MTDNTITRLGSKSFTPPEPIKLGEPRSRAPRKRVARDGFTPHVPAVDIFSDQAAPEDRSVPAKDLPVETAAPPAQSIEAERDIAAIETPAFDAEMFADAKETHAEPAKAFATKREPKISMRKRLAILAAVIAIPSVVASGDFGAVPGAAPGADDWMANLSGPEAMPFEKAGMSFPGSAFYYVDASSEDSLLALPSADPLAVGGEFGRDIGSLIDAGPAASAFFVAGSVSSQARAQQCLSQAVFYEAGTEGEAAQRAVAQVILNRVAHPRWPGSVCGVTYEGSQRASGCEFKFTCDGSLARKPGGESWSRAQDIARDALGGKVYAPIGLATHYHTRWAAPAWAEALSPIGTIGAHRFYRARGEAGEKSAFTGTYSGIEPSVGGRTPRAPAAAPRRASSASSPSVTRTPSPRRPSRAATSTPAPSRNPATSASGAPTVAPTPASVATPTPPQPGQVKERYSNAGQWKKRPQDSGATAPAADTPKE